MVGAHAAGPIALRDLRDVVVFGVKHSPLFIVVRDNNIGLDLDKKRQDD